MMLLIFCCSLTVEKNYKLYLINYPLISIVGYQRLLYEKIDTVPKTSNIQIYKLYILHTYVRK